MKQLRSLPFTLVLISVLALGLAIPAAAYLNSRASGSGTTVAVANAAILPETDTVANVAAETLPDTAAVVEAVPLAAPDTLTLASDSPEDQTAAATTGTCPVLVQQALDVTEQGCEGTRRNEVCYGHNTLDANPQPDAGQFVFESEGDRVSVVEMQSLRLERMNENAGTWGVALLRLQASLPESSPDNVTVILFGDVALSNNAANMPTLPVHNDTGYNINVRSAPSDTSPVVALLAPGSSTIANGRLATGTWLRVAVPGSAESGWVLSRFMTAPSELSTLAEVAPGSSSFGPMQAFTFTSGLNDAPCSEAPQSGLMIQTPHGMGKITFLINEVDVQLGSTVFFQAMPGQRMAIHVIEGSARVTTNGQTQTAIAGTSMNVPLNAENHPAGAPSVPQPYEKTNVQALPVTLLPREVTVPDPISPEAYAAFYNTASAQPAQPAQPAVPAVPAVPGESPAQPAIPANPAVPADPAAPIDLAAPVDPAVDPVVPMDPANAAIPAVPAVPGVSPAVPAQPAHPANPSDGAPPPGQVDNPSAGSDLPPGLIDNPGLGDSLPPGQGGSPPGQDKKEGDNIPPGQDKKDGDNIPPGQEKKQ